MISRDEFMKLNDQAKWDLYCLLVSECGDSDEVDDADESLAEPMLDPYKGAYHGPLVHL